MKTLDLYDLYTQLHLHLGGNHKWPAASKEEIILGAVLVQNTNWRNVELTLERLQVRTGFAPTQILSLPRPELEELIRPSGFFVNKGLCILEVFGWLSGYGFDYGAISATFGEGLRKELLKIRGIGDETADVLMLYVFERPVFISDKYAQKLLGRLGWEGLTNYKKTAKQVSLPSRFTVEEAQEFHILILEFGKLYLNRGKRFEDSFLA